MHFCGVVDLEATISRGRS